LPTYSEEQISCGEFLKQKLTQEGNKKKEKKFFVMRIKMIDHGSTPCSTLHLYKVQDERK